MAPLTIQQADPTGERAHPIEFVDVGDGSTLPATRPVEDLTLAVEDLTPADETAVFPPGPILPVPEPGWSLWGDTER